MMHEIGQHLYDNWHKYGVALLLLKEAKGLYDFISNIKSAQETFAWLWKKLGFKKEVH